MQYHLPTSHTPLALNGSAFNDLQIWLGLSKLQSQQKLTQHHLHSISFAHWLSIPKLGIILTFKHQCCVEASYL